MEHTRNIFILPTTCGTVISPRGTKGPACVSYILFVVHMGWGCVQGQCTCREVKLIIRVLSDRGCGWLMAALTACRAQALCFHITLLLQFADFKEDCLEPFWKVTKSSSKTTKLEHCVLSCHRNKAYCSFVFYFIQLGLSI